MKSLFLAGAAAFAVLATPSLAQVGEVGPGATTATVADKRGMEMTDEQRAVYDALPAEQRTAFDAWKPDDQTTYLGWDDALRGYYWQLEPAQQEAWWYLDDAQRISVYQLTEPQRGEAWTSIVAQVNEMRGQQASSQAAGHASGAPAHASNMPAKSGNVAYTQREIVQSTPMAERPAEYPVCKSDADDSCINAWAAGQRGPGVDRPLDHWPGEPASS